MKVIGRNSAFQFRNTKDDAQTIGAKLGVAHLLEGSVRRQGDEVPISAELIDTRDASTLWLQHYDRPYKELFALRDDITHAVASALQAKLRDSGGAVLQSDRPPSGNLGRLDEAAAAVHKAIELQPVAATYHEQLAVVEIQRDDAAAALAAAQAQPANRGWQEIALARGRQIGPDRAASDAALKHLIDTQADISPYQIAEVYALRRDPDNMFKWLDRAWASRDPGFALLLHAPFILRYQHDPRFAAFCKKVGLLTTTTTAKAMPLD